LCLRSGAACSGVFVFSVAMTCFLSNGTSAHPPHRANLRRRTRRQPNHRGAALQQAQALFLDDGKGFNDRSE
jgi:hypothetical protein